jgi:autotransporter passenger strand-loop-strand repeat protein
VLASGHAIQTTVLGGGSQVVARGLASQDVVSSGGVVIASDGGMVANATIRSGGMVEVFGDAAFNRLSGGLEVVFSGGEDRRTLVAGGGVLRISGGGAALAARVLGGGTETVLAGGLARATVLSGGTEFNFGQTLGTVILSGGHERIMNHATATASVVAFGGLELVSSGGVAVAATVSGGTLSVAAGAALSGGLSLHGGKAVISGAMAVGQSVVFTGSAGVLELDNLAGFHAAISGLATASQKIDLGGFDFSGVETVSWTQSGTSGTLSVVDGAKTASLTLVGTYVTSDFTLSDDGHKGTFVADPRPGHAAAHFVAAIAGVRGGRSAGAAFVAVGAAPSGVPPRLMASTSRR